MARPQQGFVLVVVLAVLAILVLLASSVALSSRRAVEEASAQQEQFQSELDMVSTRETLLFMLATQGRTLAGLRLDHAPPSDAAIDEDMEAWMPRGNEIRLDGRPYQGVGDALFSLQDDRGLISVNWAPAWMRTALFQSLGAADAPQWARLEDIRLDFQDADALRRLNGAEEDEYRKAGLPPPPNRTLSSPLELRQMLQWRDLLSGLDDAALLGRVTTTRDTSLNLNTAPTAVLALLPGMNAAEAERLVALRELTPIVSLYEAQQAFPLPPAIEESLNLYANNSGNLILWDRRFGTKRLSHWTLTSLGDTEKPWRIDYEVTLPRGNQSDQPVAGKPETPLLSAPGPAGQ